MTKYTLVEKRNSNRNQFKVSITGDYNDGDYSTRTGYFTKEEFEQADGVYEELKNLEDNFSGHHDLEDFPAEWLWLPSGNDMRCHTLEELVVEYIDENGKVWDVIL